MPARLPSPASKHDIRLFDADVDFMRPLLERQNSTLNDFVRDLFHRAANLHRARLGLPVEGP